MLMEISKQILQVIRNELSVHYRDRPEDIKLYISENNIYNVYGLITGNRGTPFAGGQYIARLTLPPEYPLKAPKLVLLTPNGRFTINEELCFSFTDRYNRSVMHKNSSDGWRPTWTFEAMFRVLLSIMITPPPSEDGPVVGLLTSDDTTISHLAKKSETYNRIHFSDIIDCFDIIPDEFDEHTKMRAAVEAAQSIANTEDSDEEYDYIDDS